MSSLLKAVETGVTSTQLALDVTEFKLQKQWREEDIAHRNKVNEVRRREVDNVRRAVDEKAQQLKSISHLSALIAGFSMVCMVEVQIAPQTTKLLIYLFASASTLVVTLMLIGMVNCTLALVGLYNFEQISDQCDVDDFRSFWLLHVQSDWQRCVWLFVHGVSCFFVNLVLLSWVIFEPCYSCTNQSDPEASLPHFTVAAIISTFLGLLGLFYWYTQVHWKWSKFMQMTTPRRGLGRGASVASHVGASSAGAGAAAAAGAGLGLSLGASVGSITDTSPGALPLEDEAEAQALRQPACEELRTAHGASIALDTFNGPNSRTDASLALAEHAAPLDRNAIEDQV